MHKNCAIPVLMDSWLLDHVIYKTGFNYKINLKKSMIVLITGVLYVKTPTHDNHRPLSLFFLWYDCYTIDIISRHCYHIIQLHCTSQLTVQSHCSCNFLQRHSIVITNKQPFSLFQECLANNTILRQYGYSDQQVVSYSLVSNDNSKL